MAQEIWNQPLPESFDHMNEAQQLTVQRVLAMRYVTAIHDV